MCVCTCPTTVEVDLRRGAETFAGARTFHDALGQLRCGLTGVLTKKCGCAYELPYNFSSLASYRGDPSYDWENDTFYRPAGQAPLAITTGPRYLHVYEVEQHYGGPEEGGWWYSSGEPVEDACRELPGDMTQAEIDELVAATEREYPTTRRRYSVLGGLDFDVYVDTEPPAAYPSERPTYC